MELHNPLIDIHKTNGIIMEKYILIVIAVLDRGFVQDLMQIHKVKIGNG